MMNMMTGAVAINGGVGVMEVRQPQMVEKAVQDAGHIAADIAENAHITWVFGSTVSEGMAAEIKRAHELQKKVRNLPEPGRVVELLLKNISEQYHVPLDDKKTEGQQEVAESEEDNGE